MGDYGHHQQYHILELHKIHVLYKSVADNQLKLNLQLELEQELVVAELEQELIAAVRCSRYSALPCVFSCVDEVQGFFLVLLCHLLSHYI
jgi:hypothetical protein